MTVALVSTKSRPRDGRRCGCMQVWLGERKPSGLAISDWVITEFPAALSMKLRSGQIEAIYPARRASDVLGAAETLAVPRAFATLLPPKTGASFAHTNETNIGLWPVLRVRSD